MDPIPAPAFIAAGAITAAVIAGLFSFFNLVLSKEQKVSEFRQAWIDGLRDDLSLFFAATCSIAYLAQAYRRQHGHNVNSLDLANTLSEPHAIANAALSRIMLRLSPSDRSDVQKGLARTLEDVRQASNGGDYDEALRHLSTLREQGQLVLKDEWDRVKAGEPTYRRSKGIAMLVLVTGLALGAIFAIRTLVQPATGSFTGSSDPPAAQDGNASSANKRE